MYNIVIFMYLDPRFLHYIVWEYNLYYVIVVERVILYTETTLLMRSSHVSNTV